MGGSPWKDTHPDGVSGGGMYRSYHRYGGSGGGPKGICLDGVGEGA